MKKLFLNYMKRELVKYIRFELDKGYTLDEIKETLHEGGHNQNLIDEAIGALERNNYNLEKAIEEPLKNDDLHNYLVRDVERSLVRYVKLQLKKGYSPDEIKDILLNYGHSREIIDDVLKEVGKSEVLKIRTENEIEVKNKGMSRAFNSTMRFSILIISFFALIILVFFTAASTNESLGGVIEGFFPLIIYYMILVLFIRSVESNKRNILLYLPVGLAVLFYIAGIYNLFGTIQYQKLFFINIIFSYVLAYFFLKIEPKKEKILKPEGVGRD